MNSCDDFMLDETARYAWTPSDVARLMSDGAFGGLSRRECRPVADMLDAGILTIKAEIYEPPIIDTTAIYPRGNEGIWHARLKVYAQLWLKSIGEQDIEVESYVSCGIADVASENYIVECGNTTPTKLTHWLIHNSRRNNFTIIPYYCCVCTPTGGHRCECHTINVANVQAIDRMRAEYREAQAKVANLICIPWEPPEVWPTR